MAIEIPEWDSNNTNSIEPAAGLKTDGFEANDALPAATFNWLHRQNALNWQETIDEFVDVRDAIEELSVDTNLARLIQSQKAHVIDISGTDTAHFVIGLDGAVAAMTRASTNPYYVARYPDLRGSLRPAVEYPTAGSTSNRVWNGESRLLHSGGRIFLSSVRSGGDIRDMLVGVDDNGRHRAVAQDATVAGSITYCWINPFTNRAYRRISGSVQIVTFSTSDGTWNNSGTMTFTSADTSVLDKFEAVAYPYGSGDSAILICFGLADTLRGGFISGNAGTSIDLTASTPAQLSNTGAMDSARTPAACYDAEADEVLTCTVAGTSVRARSHIINQSTGTLLGGTNLAGTPITVPTGATVAIQTSTNYRYIATLATTTGDHKRVVVRAQRRGSFTWSVIYDGVTWLPGSVQPRMTASGSHVFLSLSPSICLSWSDA